MTHRSICTAVLLVFQVLAVAVHAANPPSKADWLMVVLGDSVSAATFADRSAGTVRSDDPVPADGSWSEDGLLPSRGALVPFLGNKENKANYSWASGKKIVSHFQLLKKSLGADGDRLTVYNAAVPGARTNALEKQVDDVIKKMSADHITTLKYVTVMIGANDACAGQAKSGTYDLQMAADLDKAFKKLAQINQKEPIRVLVSGLPKIPDLAKRHIKNLITFGGWSCATVRDSVMNMCQPMLNWKTESEYLERVSRVKAKSDLIRKAVADAKKAYPTLDLVFTDTFFESPIEVKFLARDCFHPNARGQSEIARKLWRDQPWYH